MNYMGAVFEPLSLALLVGGTIGGLILGATPGLSPAMAVALLIPFTFHLQPAQGLILLGAAYTSTVAGGAVSAILLKIPGALANIATALDDSSVNFRGLMVPAGTPQDVIDALSATVPDMFNHGRVVGKMVAGGSPMKVMSREEVQAMWAERQSFLETLLAGL